MDIGIVFVFFSFGINVIDKIDIVFVSFSLESNGIDNIDIVFVSFSLETYGIRPFALNWPEISQTDALSTRRSPCRKKHVSFPSNLSFGPNCSAYA